MTSDSAQQYLLAQALTVPSGGLPAMQKPQSLRSSEFAQLPRHEAPHIRVRVGQRALEEGVNVHSLPVPRLCVMEGNKE